MRTGKSEAAKKDKFAGIAVDDSEFYTDPTAYQKESVLEQNIEWVLTQHKDCLRGKCLEAKLPILKQSLYKKDYVPHPHQKVIKEDSLNPWNGFKPNASLPINSTHRVVRGSAGRLHSAGQDQGRTHTPQQEQRPHPLAAAEREELLVLGSLDSSQNDYVDWGNNPPPRSIPPSISNLAQGLPFFGKTTNKDYGDFKGLNEIPIKLDPSFFKGK